MRRGRAILVPLERLKAALVIEVFSAAELMLSLAALIVGTFIFRCLLQDLVIVDIFPSVLLNRLILLVMGDAETLEMLDWLDYHGSARTAHHRGGSTAGEGSPLAGLKVLMEERWSVELVALLAL